MNKELKLIKEYQEVFVNSLKNALNKQTVSFEELKMVVSETTTQLELLMLAINDAEVVQKKAIDVL